jgi:methyl-accepting chemotaxis protein
MVKMMSELLAQTDIIIKGAADGELDKRANATLFVGGWNKLVMGVNATVTNIVNPLNVTADYVDRIAKGDMPPVITPNTRASTTSSRTTSTPALRPPTSKGNAAKAICRKGDLTVK